MVAQLLPPRPKKRRLNTNKPQAIDSQLAKCKDNKEKSLFHKIPKPKRPALSTTSRINSLLATSFVNSRWETPLKCQHWRVASLCLFCEITTKYIKKQIKGFQLFHGISPKRVYFYLVTLMLNPSILIPSMKKT